MMRAWVAVACWWAVSAIAAPVGLDLRAVSVPEIAELVFKTILKRDYMLGAGINTADPKVTLSVAAVAPDKVLATVAAALAEHGIAVDTSGPVVRIYRRPPSGAGAGDPGSAERGIAGAACPTCAAIAAGQVQGVRPAPVELVPAEPVEVVAYRPKGKSVEFLQAVVKLAGVEVADLKGGDTLVYSGTAAQCEKAAKLLGEVDRPSIGLTVRATLLEFSENHSDTRSLAVALSALAGRIGLKYEAGIGAVNAVAYTGSRLQAVLSAIEGDNRFRYLAEPSVRVMDGQRARLVVGSDVPTRSGITTDKNGNPVQAVEYRTAGVVITVEPRIVGDAVVVRVGQQISSFAVTTTSNIDSPTIFKREAETTVSAKPGELIVLAGMDEDRESGTRSGLSFLPDWMHSQGHDKTRSQLVLLLEVNQDAGG